MNNCFIVLGIKLSIPDLSRKCLWCINVQPVPLLFWFFFKDIDECLMQPCHKFAQCTNIPGSFQCSCIEGYSGNGFTCTGMIK